MATKPTVPSADRIAFSIKQLTQSATRLNAASDELARAIGPLDSALKRLNLGVTAWHEYMHSEDQHGNFWNRAVGYAKVGDKWGVAISASSLGRYGDEDTEEWLFNDAPRWMRIEAIDHIPDLLDALVKEANKIASDLDSKTAQARELAATITSLVPETQSRR